MQEPHVFGVRVIMAGQMASAHVEWEGYLIVVRMLNGTYKVAGKFKDRNLCRHVPDEVFWSCRKAGVAAIKKEMTRLAAGPLLPLGR